LSSGGDVVISSAVHADPEVAEMIYGAEAELTASRFEVMLKGFDEEQFELWRVRPASCVAAEDERAVHSDIQ
jgi:hypothetical protein